MIVDSPAQISIGQWDDICSRARPPEDEASAYSGSLSRHVKDGNIRLESLMFDNSQAALALWNFLLTEEDRLYSARNDGKKLIGTMKDLGTLPVMVYAYPEFVAFYPDGAWWIPCLMQNETDLLEAADRMGIDESFCPVRAMLGAFVKRDRFPVPDISICSVGATCDDFSAIAQRIEGMGYAVLWWEVPHRREPGPGEDAVELPGGFNTTCDQIAFVKEELIRIRKILSKESGRELTDQMLSNGISAANKIRACLSELRTTVFTARVSPLPALEMLIAEMMAIHFCSDRDEVLKILSDLLETVKNRVNADAGYLGPDAVKIFWINPVADLRVMNVLEECGGRICGTEYLFTHALDQIPADIPPMEALSRMAIADPMVGSSYDRVRRIWRDIQDFGSEAVVISRIPGASHCALEGAIIKEALGYISDIPILEIEVPAVSDTYVQSLRTRLDALVETVRHRRGERQDADRRIVTNGKVAV